MRTFVEPNRVCRRICVIFTVGLLIFDGFAALAFGGDHSGGGSGCMSEVQRSAEVVIQDLRLEGRKLNPPVRASAFAGASRPTSFKFVDEKTDLQYEGAHVDAYFNGETILVRCDRFEKNSIDGRARVVAHEIFRKMAIEGGNYEVSRQLAIFQGGLHDRSCGEIQEAMSKLLSTYIDAFKTCYDLEQAGQSAGSTYRLEIAIARQVEATYPEGIQACHQYCPDTSPCDGPKPAGACSIRK